MRNKGSYSGIFIIAITGFFLGSFLLLVVFGAGVYRQIVDLQKEVNSTRALSSYLLTAGKMNENEVSVAEGEYGKMLVIADGDTGYGNRIYVYEGELIEDYGQIGGKLYPGAGIKIAPTAVFDIDELEDDLIRVTTSAGEVYIHTRESRP